MEDEIHYLAIAQNILLKEMNFSLRSRVLSIIYPLRFPYSDLAIDELRR